MIREVPGRVGGVGVCAVALASLLVRSHQGRPADPTPSRAPAVPAPAAVASDAARETPGADTPLSSIEENAGQADPGVLFLARGARYTALFFARGVELVSAGGAGSVRLTFEPRGEAAAGVEATSER